MISPGIIAKAEEKDVRRQLAQIRAAGFEYLSLCVSSAEKLSAELSRCREAGVPVRALFAPYDRMNAVWQAGVEGDAVIGDLENLAEAAGRAGIREMLLRVTEEEAPPAITQVGLDRFRRLAAEAKRCGVRLCFENRKNEEYLQIVLAVCDPFHGFCWNIGNQTADAGEVDYFALHSDRLLAVRLSDTCSTADGYMRTLPGDGDTDWDAVAKRLGELGYEGPIFADTYLQWETYGALSYPDFLAKAYEKTRQILQKIREYRASSAQKGN